MPSVTEDLPVESRSRPTLGVAERCSHRRRSGIGHHGASQQLGDSIGVVGLADVREGDSGTRRRSARSRWLLEMVGGAEYTEYQAISPLLRSDFAQSTVGRTPHGDLTDSFVPSDGRAA